MARVTEMRYPNGWVEYYTYDKMGRLLAVDDTHPSEKPAKPQKHTCRYDTNGNMTYEYMRGNGTGQAKNETLYTYDALNRLITAHDNYGNSTRTYTYDSLGNLTYETGNGSHNCDYIYNNFNQQVNRSSDNWKSHTASTYDNRGNLILEQYGKNKKLETAGEYTYDETNKMVRGVNGNGEESIYTYNGLGALMENTWIIAKNGYGYHDVSDEEDATPPTDPTPDVPDPGETTDPDTPDSGETTDPDTPDPDTPDPGGTTDPETPDPGVNNEGNGNNNGNNGNGHSNGNNGNHNGANKGNGNNGSGSNDDNADDPDTTDVTEATDATETTAADSGILTASLVAYGNAGNGNNGNNGNGNGNQDKPTGSDVKKTSTVVKQFVVDFSSETYRPLMEHEVNGLDYRYVYSDKARLSVVVQGIENGSASLLDSRGELHAYYHCDYLGTTDYLTSAVNSKVISWTSYSEWGEITHNAVLKCGQRELDLVKEYATHDFDAVLNMYYAKARFYDADNRRFVAVDPILDPSQYDLREYVTDPMQLVQYLYVKDNAVNWIDPIGEFAISGTMSAVIIEGIKDLSIAAGTAVAVYLVTPDGQKAVQDLARALDMQLQSFASTAIDIGEQIDDAIRYFDQVRCDIVQHVQEIVDTAVKTGEVDRSWKRHTVYVHYDTTNAKIYYVGRTNNFARRYREHSRVVMGFHTSKHPIGPDVGRDMIPIVSNLDFAKSKIVEQVLISAFTLEALDNARNEFSKSNWQEAIEEVNRAIEILGSNVGLEGLL